MDRAVSPRRREFMSPYEGSNLDRIAFPMGGLGGGMICLDGNGALSALSIRHQPDLGNTPPFFAALSMGGEAKVIEGPPPNHKIFGPPQAALGLRGSTLGLPRFSRTESFTARFPFATVQLADAHWPVIAKVTGWSPFIPSDEDNSSLPICALEYELTNISAAPVDMTFSYSAQMFEPFSEIASVPRGFLLKDDEAELAIWVDKDQAVVDHCWYRGTWFAPLTAAWRNIREGRCTPVTPKPDATGATISVPLRLAAGESETVRVTMAWYVPSSQLRLMGWRREYLAPDAEVSDADRRAFYHRPWYASRFGSIGELIDYWDGSYRDLRGKSGAFADAFFSSTLPSEAIEAVSANLSILKSPTILRQFDGRLWAWEGSADASGHCPGSCTHVWNYAQAISHLFPRLEQSLRDTEFQENQNETGEQMFRTALPIRPAEHEFIAAADGQLGGLLKAYRDWRISGDTEWLKSLYPQLKSSLDFCIRTWDPKRRGLIEEPHHNTFDIEFWCAEPMCTGLYLGALLAFSEVAEFLGEDATAYRQLLDEGRSRMETELFNGEYFFQKDNWDELQAGDPAEHATSSLHRNRYTEDDLAILPIEGPKNQYGTGCLSDGLVGVWLAWACGLDGVIDREKTARHVRAVVTHNFKPNLSLHSNPQRAGYATAAEGGLLLCSWPRGGERLVSFPYSEEVWTGVEYAVASHLISLDMVEEGLEIVRATRRRYDGQIRNPFDEYECGHWYGRALSSYALLQALTGLRYDAVKRTLFVNSKIGDFRSFLATTNGFGVVTFQGGEVRWASSLGKLDIRSIVVA